MLLRRIPRAMAPLWVRSSFGWNELRCTSLFFKGRFIVRHIEDYAMAPTSPRGDNHLGFCTVGIDHEQGIVDEAPTCELPCVDRWRGRIGFCVVAVSGRAP